MSTVNRLGEQRVVMENVPWDTYVSLAEDTNGLRGRITYDQGTMEIMSPSKSHESIGRLIGRMIEIFTLERQIDIVSVASLTVKLKPKERGFEADESYYIQRAHLVRGKEELDFAFDPAPDLVVEVDISSSSMPKQQIFADFDVTEWWRYDAGTLEVFVLQGGKYTLCNESQVLPGFPFEQLRQLLNRRTSASETGLMRQFQSWVRDNN